MALRMHQSLGTRLTVVSAILGLGPLVLMGMLALQVVTATHRQDVGTMEQQLLRQKVGEVNDFIEQAIGLFEIKIGYDYPSIIDKAGGEFLLTKLLEENKFITRASLVDLTGEEVYRNSRLQDVTRVRPVNIRQLPQFEAAKSGTRYFGPVEYTLNGPTMTMAAPVVNRNGQVIMVLEGDVNLAPLATTVESARLGNNGYVYLVDGAGTIFASADRGRIGTNLGTSAWVRELVRGTPHTGLAAADEHTGISGTDVLAAGEPLQKLGWGMVAEWSRQDAFSVIAAIQQQVILFSVGTILVVAFLGWLVGRRILIPLGLLSRGAQKIGGGDFDYKIQVRTGDELQVLGEVMNRMGDDLKRLEELKAAQVRAEALAESLRKEQELSRIKDEFISNTSHQLRTPLTIMNWNMELIADAATKKQQVLLSDFQAGLAQLNAIVQDLIAVSEFGPGFANTILEPVDLAAVVAKVAASREKTFAEKQLVWKLDVPSDLPKVAGSVAGLALAVENLVDNAITYTPVGGRIAASIIREGDQVHFTLTDTGIGIPADDQKSIFLQFFRAKNAVSMKNVGTGLGLYLVRNIVHGHGGEVRFESAEGKGTTFHVLLPIGRVRVAGGHNASGSAPTASPHETYFGGVEKVAG